jgi:hypothetical protein
MGDVLLHVVKIELENDCWFYRLFSSIVSVSIYIYFLTVWHLHSCSRLLRLTYDKNVIFNR